MAKVKWTHNWGQPDLVPIGPDLVAPRRYQIDVDDEDLPYTMEVSVIVEEGVPVCDSLRLVRRPEGPPISALDVRAAPLGWIRTSIEWVALKQTVHPGGERTFTPQGKRDGEAFEAVVRTEMKRKGIDLDRLTAVVKAYREGQESGAPVKHVAEKLGMSRRNASKLVKVARDQGFLDKP